MDSYFLNSCPTVTTIKDYYYKMIIIIKIIVVVKTITVIYDHSKVMKEMH